MGITRVILVSMKVAISIPDPIFEDAERIAERLGVSRSQLYAQAVEELVKVHRGDAVRAALKAVYGSEPPGMDPVLEQLQADALREDW